jgi:hypothetical protein
VSVTMIDLLTISEMSFVECGNLHKPTDFFVIPSVIPGTVLMSPNAIANLTLWWPK